MIKPDCVLSYLCNACRVLESVGVKRAVSNKFNPTLVSGTRIMVGDSNYGMELQPEL